MMSTKLVSQQINHLILVQDCLAQIESRLKLLKDCSNKVNWSLLTPSNSMPTSKGKPMSLAKNCLAEAYVWIYVSCIFSLHFA